MEIKKNPKYDLEPRKGFFLELGLVFALVIVLTSFEWKKTDSAGNDWDQLQVVDIPEEMVEITRQEEPEPPKPEPQTTLLEIVDDNVDVQDDLDINAEDDQDNEVGDFVAPIQDDDEPDIIEAEIFTIVEEQPGFPGGESALMEYLGRNIKYPQLARESNIQGTVFVTFVVEPNGSISNVKTLRGIGGGCDEEALRVVKSMPNWTPGKQRGKPVRVQFNLPIRFVLQG
ncbi:MAG: energy transducer TonB [Bacteroidetes bacterium HGW-Bacteroidetes-6]|jgi:protein TonB|nr:MAG: energy transducer TonB [Bacteroidetes bacterium HGW-Bacteroidetes-6]